jgi:hypothetical protein
MITVGNCRLLRSCVDIRQKAAPCAGYCSAPLAGKQGDMCWWPNKEQVRYFVTISSRDTMSHPVTLWPFFQNPTGSKPAEPATISYGVHDALQMQWNNLLRTIHHRKVHASNVVPTSTVHRRQPQWQMPDP